MKLLPANQYKSFKGPYSKEEYIECIKAMNATLGDMLATRQYFFTLTKGLGVLAVKVVKRHLRKSHIDHHASFQYKKELIEKGLTPLEHYRDSEGNIIGNNGGEEWLVYRTDESYRLCRWIKKWQYVKHKNAKYYRFKAAGGAHPEAFRRKISLAP